ncbi:MAG: DUF5127 domain-containing protein [Armatimonas sp.]
MRKACKQSQTLPSRLPAIPLITHDPYFSVWSFSDRLNDSWTRHWTGTTQALTGFIRIDGKAYRWAGTSPAVQAPMTQTRVTVTATRTTYTFEQDGVALTITFVSPLLADDLDLLSTPVTHVLLEAKATDGKPHSVAIYIDTTGEWVVNQTGQSVTWSRHRLGGMEVLKLGTSRASRF